jgi:hypothetical protein
MGLLVEIVQPNPLFATKESYQSEKLALLRWFPASNPWHLVSSKRFPAAARAIHPRKENTSFGRRFNPWGMLFHPRPTESLSSHTDSSAGPKKANEMSVGLHPLRKPTATENSKPALFAQTLHPPAVFFSRIRAQTTPFFIGVEYPLHCGSPVRTSMGPSAIS